MSKHWEITIREAFEDSGISATEEQIQNVISWVVGMAENESTYTGRDCISNPLEDEISQLKIKHKKEVESLEKDISSFKKSVAERCGVSERDVYLENGKVMYDPR